MAYLQSFPKKVLVRSILHKMKQLPVAYYFQRNFCFILNCDSGKRTGLFYSHCFFNCCNFHSTSIVWKRKDTERKKMKNVLSFKPKSKQPIFQVWRGVTVREIATQLNRSIGDVFEAMRLVENCQQYNHADSEIHIPLILQQITKYLGCRIVMVANPHIKKTKLRKDNDVRKRPPPLPSELIKRPPIVTIMGHVDHGKTTLLDSLRHTCVVKEEFGGITQHIGAFTVRVSHGEITFLDTPGHAAFKAMRARGANVTDLVVLVVAADDGVMNQTIESIKFANEAGVPIIVAINKIDKDKADADAIGKELLKYGIQLEDLGGEVQSVCISALKKINLDCLTEAILTQAEILEIGCDPTGPVEGVILESTKDTAKGKQCTCLIQRGTLKKGSFLVSGTSWAKVKGMLDEWEKPLQEVKPGFPVRVLGWKSYPTAGDDVLEVSSEKQAREIVEYRSQKQLEKKMESDSIVIQEKTEAHFEKYRKDRNERLMLGFRRKRKAQNLRQKEIIDDPTPCLSLVLKGDVNGSVEAILDVLYTYYSHHSCRLEIINSEIGDVTENDVELADAFNGIIYCFNTGILPSAKAMINEKVIPVKDFNVIYHLIDDIKCEINKRLPLVDEEEITGEAIVLQQFLINEGKREIPVAGCRCIEGNIKIGSLCKVIRSNEVIHTGSIVSLRHEKSDVASIKKNVECGLKLQDTEVTFESDDKIVCFNLKKVPQFTDWNPGF